MSASVSSKITLAASAVFASAIIYGVHRYQRTEQEVRGQIYLVKLKVN